MVYSDSSVCQEETVRFPKPPGSSDFSGRRGLLVCFSQAVFSDGSAAGAGSGASASLLFAILI